MEVVVLDIFDIDNMRPLIDKWVASRNTDEFGLPIPTVDCVVDSLKQLTSARTTCVLGLFDGSEIQGFIGGVITHSHFCNTDILNECFWFVDPKVRRYAKRLINAVSMWAKSKGCSHVVITASLPANNNAERVGLLLEHWGLKAYEKSFIGVL